MWKRLILLVVLAAWHCEGQDINATPAGDVEVPDVTQDMGSGDRLGTLTLTPGPRVTKYLGEMVRFMCSFSPADILGKDEAAITWRKDGGPIGDLGTVESDQAMPQQSFLILPSITAAHAGMYRCGVTDASGHEYSARSLLVITERPSPATPGTTTTGHKKSFDPHSYQRICRPGCKGQMGDEGPEGEDGPRGPAGSPGPQGAPGATLRRPIKIQILKGEKGYPGAPGPAGSPGAHGMHGIPGLPGPQGPAGTAGRKGEVGYPGMPGAPGAVGQQGDIGPKGFPGRDGIAGMTGPRGEKGDRGLKGEMGQQGIDGVAGIPGNPGQVGPPGDQGPIGPSGPQGEQGDQGDQGATGPRGQKGEMGRKGDMGFTGEQGDMGTMGAQGEDGDKGVEGTKGEPGPEVYIRLQINHGPCNSETAGDVAYDPELGKLYFCNGQTWECVDDGGCTGCEEFVSQWSQWSTCSATCGAGQKRRTRTVIQQPDFALQDCPLEETMDCNSGPCGICTFQGEELRLNQTRFIIQASDIAADVLIVVDESNSMEGEHKWLPGMVESLEDLLFSRDVGSGSLRNMYALVGFGRKVPNHCASAHTSGNKLLFEQDEYIAANNKLIADDDGQREDGYQAIRYALQRIPWRRNVAGIARNLILITDEDRDTDCDQQLTAQATRELILGNGFIMNAVLDQRYNVTTDGGVTRRRALGIRGTTDGARSAYFQAPGGTYTPVAGASVDITTATPLYNRYTRRDYTDWTLGMGGVTWDLNILREGGAAPQSFDEAFVDIKTREIIESAKACMACRCEGSAAAPEVNCVPSSVRPDISDAQCTCIANGNTWIAQTNTCDTGA